MRDIPCLLMRGGTSRGPYFNAADLPSDRDQLARVLIAVMGAGSPLQVDGIGGGQPTTSKVAMLSKSSHDGVDIDYFFAQVHAEKSEIDFSPSCGNILAGVGPAAIELGLVTPGEEITSVKIRSVNTESRVEALVETPNGRVNYEGLAEIDGVPGSAAPVQLNFSDVIGSKSGHLFPTGSSIDTINGFELTCIDVAMPMVIGRAKDFGLTGYESRDVIDANKTLFKTFEPLRIEAGKRMGFGDVSQSVVPKFGLLAPAKEGGAIAARYFMPWSCHPTFAVTGSICTASCLLAGGTVADGLASLGATNPCKLVIEHPSGHIDVVMDSHRDASGKFYLQSAGVIRTARRIMSGSVAISPSVWV